MLESLQKIFYIKAVCIFIEPNLLNQNNDKNYIVNKEFENSYFTE